MDSNLINTACLITSAKSTNVNLLPPNIAPIYRMVQKYCHPYSFGHNFIQIYYDLLFIMQMTQLLTGTSIGNNKIIFY